MYDLRNIVLCSFYLLTGAHACKVTLSEFRFLDEAGPISINSLEQRLPIINILE